MAQIIGGNWHKSNQLKCVAYYPNGEIHSDLVDIDFFSTGNDSLLVEFGYSNPSDGKEGELFVEFFDDNEIIASKSVQIVN